MPYSPEQLRRAKYRRIHHQRGLGPFFIGAAETKRHLRSLWCHPDGGMTQEMIATDAGVSAATVCELLKGRRGRPVDSLHRDTATKLLAVQWRQPSGKGAKTDQTGTVRRVRALTAVGFNYDFIAGELDMTPRMCGRFAHEQVTFVYGSTAGRMAALYEKISAADPLDFGLTPRQAAIARGTARRHNWPPVHCWDAESIDDPAAIAEWTGACGTPEGYHIHRRENIPACTPCMQAAATESGDAYGFPGFAFTSQKLIDLREAKDLTRRELAAVAGVSADAVRAWEVGRSRPTRAFAQKIAIALDVPVMDLYEEM